MGLRAAMGHGGARAAVWRGHGRCGQTARSRWRGAVHGDGGTATQLGHGARSAESRWHDDAGKVDAGLGQPAVRLYEVAHP